MNPNTNVHEFSRIPRVSIQRSFFDRSSRHMTTLNAGLLYPVFVDEVLPGDTFTMSPKVFARLSTQICPTMSNLKMDLQFFYVPNRLVWDNFKKFMGEQDNPGDSIDFLVPQIQLDNFVDFTQSGESQYSPYGAKYDNNIAHYFGLPPCIDYNGEIDTIEPNAFYKVSVLPFRAYNLIWNEWYRDQNLQDSVPVNKGDDLEFLCDDVYHLLPRGKRHDYFTSCLPWPQKGDIDQINISLGDSAPVVGNGKALGLTNGEINAGLIASDSAITIGAARQIFGQNLGYSQSSPTGFRSDSAIGVTTDEQNSGLVAKLSAAMPISINTLRQAFQIQRYCEQSARSGSRYIETVKSFFGVDVPDLRVHRPEYLGGSTFDIIESTVPQTSATSVTPQGNLAAYSVFSGTGVSWTKSFSEHGFIIGLASIRTDQMYQYGVNRMWLRKTRFDFYWPTFAHLGEQAVTMKEIYVRNENVIAGNIQNDTVFGYQERYAEYRYKPNLVTGRLASFAPETLDVWHLAQRFDGVPSLNSDFIEERPPIERNLAITSDEPQFVCDFWFGLKCARPMPVYSVPGLIDHF